MSKVKRLDKETILEIHNFLEVSEKENDNFEKQKLLLKKIKKEQDNNNRLFTPIIYKISDFNIKGHIRE